MIRKRNMSKKEVERSLGYGWKKYKNGCILRPLGFPNSKPLACVNVTPVSHTMRKKRSIVLLKIYHMVNRLQSFLSSCHPVFWSFGYSVTWSFNHLVIQSLVHSVTQLCGHSVIQSLGHSVTWSLGHLVSQSVGHSVTRSFGHSVTLSFGHSVTQSQVIIPLF